MTKYFYLGGFEHRSVLERLVLKNAAECTSHRLKWKLGARVMITHTHTLGEPATTFQGNWFPRAYLYDFLTRTVRTPQAQLGWEQMAGPL